VARAFDARPGLKSHTVLHTAAPYLGVLCFLGPAALRTGGRVRPLELRPKALALLVRLSLVQGPQDRDVLAELLFPDAMNPREGLRWQLSQLRASVPLRIEADRRTVEMTASTDVARFRDGAERILRGDCHDAAAVLSLYRGDLCSGLRVTASADFDNWLYVQEDELHRILRRATLTYAQAELAGGCVDAVVPSLRRLTEVDPFLEDGHLLLIDALERDSREDEARYAYDRYQRIVRHQLNGQPRAELAHRYEGVPPAGGALPLDQLIPLETITIHIVDWPGADPPIVAIHGSTGHAYSYTAMGERLNAHVRFIAVDLRGHGFSDKPPSGYGLDEHVADLFELIDTMGLDKPILLGTSLGGAVATFAAQAAGDRISGLVLVDAVVGDRHLVERSSYAVQNLELGLQERFTDFDDYRHRWGALPDDATWRRWLDRSLRMEVAPLPDGTLRRRSIRDALINEWAWLQQNDALAALTAVTVPVLIVHADGPFFGAPYLDHASLQAQLEAARDSRLFVEHGRNHGDIVYRPSAEFIHTLKQFTNHVKANSHVHQPASP
jgi:pimeloyl-ACP methyl ester carboxylesterase/DNA-binding SARP family transcriptional activator